MKLQADWYSFLLEASREENSDREAELHNLRNSVRYRMGGWLLEAWPVGPKTISAIFKVLRFYLQRLVGGSASAKTGARPRLDEAARRATEIVFGRESPETPDGDSVWRSPDAGLVARRLDLGGPPGTLIIRIPHQEVLRRIERLRHNGWHVIWHPEKEPAAADPALVAYVRAHADVCKKRGRA